MSVVFVRREKTLNRAWRVLLLVLCFGVVSIAKGDMHISKRRIGGVHDLIGLNWHEFRQCAAAYYEKTQSSSDG